MNDFHASHCSQDMISVSHLSVTLPSHLLLLSVITARKRSLRQGNVLTCVCHSIGGEGVYSSLHHRSYISSCTGDQSQLVQEQHTGNIKFIMGYITWYTPRADTNTPLGTPPLGRHPLGYG